MKISLRQSDDKRIAFIDSESFLARNFTRYARFVCLGYTFELYGVANKPISPASKYRQVDFMDRASIGHIDFSADALLVFMGKSGALRSFEDCKGFIEANEIGLLNVLEGYVARESSARIFYLQTPLSRGSSNPIVENSDREYRSMYAVTELAAEECLQVCSDAYGVDCAVLRTCMSIGTVVEGSGSYGTFEFFERQVRGLGQVTVHGDGGQLKTFTSTGVVYSAISLLTGKERLGYRAYNLGGRAMRLVDMASATARRYCVPVVHEPWPEMDSKVDGGTVVCDSSRFDTEFNMDYAQVKS